MQARRRKAACATCHSRKVACDLNSRGSPCTNCHKAGLLDCHVHARQRLPRQIDGYRRRLEPASPSVGPSTVTQTHTERSSHANHSNEPPRTPERAPGPDSSHRDEPSTYLVEFVDQSAFGIRAIDRDARVAYVGTEVSNLSYLTRNRSATGEHKVCHQPTNRLARQATVYEPDRIPLDALQLPEKSVVDKLLEAYFDRVNVAFPIVDRTRFMSTYNARDPTNPPSLLLLQAMLLVGAHVSEDNEARQASKTSYFRRAKILFDARFERNRDVVVQAALLLCWHTDGAEDVLANAWHWTRTACSVAYGLGMHRNADPSTLVPHNKRMWRRVFWLLFICDVQVALQYGRPQAIRLDECDVLPLKAEDFQDCGIGVNVEYVMQAVGLSKIISAALRSRFGPLASGAAQQLSAIRDADQSLASWIVQLPEPLRLRPTLTTDFYASMLHLQYNTALLLLHRPRPPGSMFPDESRREDADICSAAAVHIYYLVEALRERDLLISSPSSLVHILFTAMIQLYAETRTANPVLAASSRARYDSTLSSLHALTASWPQAAPIAYFFEHRRRRNDQCPQHPTNQNEKGTAQTLQPSIDATGNTPQQPDHINGPMQLRNDNLWQDLFPEGIPHDATDALGNNDWNAWHSQYWPDVLLNDPNLSPEFPI